MSKQAYTQSRHLAALWLGLMALAWAPIPFFAPAGFRMVYVVNSYGLKWAWMLYLMSVAFLLVVGSQGPYRKMRLIGLGLSAIGWTAFMTMYLYDISYSPSMVTMLVCSVMSITILISDVRRKPRDNCPDKTLDC